MSTQPNVLPEVTMTPELAAAIQAAVSTADVRALLLAEAEKQNATKLQLDADQAAAAQAAADKVAADAKAAEEIAKANQVFSRDEVIGGQNYHFEASTEGELDRQVLNAYKVAFNTRQPEAQSAEVVDPAAQAKAAEAELLAKAELERKFKLGEISAADYIQQSGAVDAYLAAQGLSVDTLKAVVEDKKMAAVAQSWEAASEIFRAGVGADWPGGTKNRSLLGNQIAALGLTESEDKVAAMAQAWAAMKQSGAYFPNGDEPAKVVDVLAEDAKAAAIKAAAADTERVAAELKAAAAAKVRSMSSSLFGASSGTSGAPVVSPVVADAKKIIPVDASPVEILQAWKDAQVAAHQDPNEAFMSAYRGNKI